jgi:hypothetical protein
MSLSSIVFGVSRIEINRFPGTLKVCMGLKEEFPRTSIYAWD